MSTYIDNKGNPFTPPLVLKNGSVCWNPTPKMLNENGFHLDAKDEVVNNTDQNTIYKFDCYKVMEALGREGWIIKCAELKEVGLYEYFMRAPYLSTGDPLFKAVYDALSIEEKQILHQNCKYEGY